MKNSIAAIQLIESLNTKHYGTIVHNSIGTDAVLDRSDNQFSFLVNDICDMEAECTEFYFKTDKGAFHIKGTVTSHQNDFNFVEKRMLQVSNVKIFSFKSVSFYKHNPAFLQSWYYDKSERLIYDTFGKQSFAEFNFNGIVLKIYQQHHYIVIESKRQVEYELFTNTCYNILVVLGFISGKFIQDEEFVFQYEDEAYNDVKEFHYRKLRKSHFSIYHAFNSNPFAYKHLIGNDYAEELYQNNTLTNIDVNSFAKLVNLCFDGSQIQYALVLFNEANSGELSLLVKNNCFYAILEVLKKFFYDQFKYCLPNDYSQKGNIERFKLIFGNVALVITSEIKLLEKRNIFMHGDIKNVADSEMVDIMQMQITFIYKLILSYIGFQGFIIDHYAIRNNQPQKAFIKLN